MMMTMSQAARRELIRKIVNSHKEGEESVRLPWRGEGKLFPVVKVPQDSLLLNPGSHRIRAQLESHAEGRLVHDDPFSDRAQEIIAGILRQEEGFSELLNNLKMFGQREAGVMTIEGVLVNANRRVVALRDLGTEYARVAVLDPDALEPEIDLLELYLQVAKDYRRDYTFTNELLFVEDLSTQYGKTPDQIAVEVGWASSNEEKELREGRRRVEQATRLLAMIRNLQALSGGALVLTDFDENRVALEEVDQVYERMKGADPGSAARVRDVRLLAMIEGVQYRDLRWIGDGFLEEYLVPAMEDSDQLQPHIDLLSSPSGGTSDAAPGLEVLPVDDEADTGLDPSSFLRVLASSVRDERIELPTPSGRVLHDREQIRSAIADAIEEAVEEARTDSRRLDRLEAPSGELNKAVRALRKALEAFQKVSSREDFKLGKFKYLVRQAKGAIEQIMEAVEGVEKV